MSADGETVQENQSGGLPEYVSQQLLFYATATRTARWGYVTTEVTSIATAAAVPVAVAASSPDWVTAVFGAIAAISTGLRQAFNYRENWIMRAVAQEAIKADVAEYIAAGNQSGSAQVTLIRQVRATSLAETARWKDVLDRARSDGIAKSDENTQQQ